MFVWPFVHFGGFQEMACLILLAKRIAKHEIPAFVCQFQGRKQVLLLPMKVLLLVLLSCQYIFSKPLSAYRDEPKYACTREESMKLQQRFSSYAKLVRNMSKEDQARLLIKKIPGSLDEALDLFVREVLLYQSFHLEQIATLEALHANPKENKVLVSYLKTERRPTPMFYRDAIYHVAWCNVLIRYAGWIARNRHKARNQVDRLFEMLYRFYIKYFNGASEGLEATLMSSVDVNFLDTWSISWILFKTREEFLPTPSNLRQTVWFHDSITPGLILYSRTTRILLPFITKAANTKIAMNQNIETSYPMEFALLFRAPTDRLNRIAGSIETASFKDIANVWSECSKMDAFRVITDWADESVTDFDFEKSFINPLGLPDLEVPSIATRILDELEREQKAKRQKKNKKKNERKRQKKKMKQASDASPSLWSMAQSGPAEPVDDDNKSYSIDNKENGPSVYTQAEEVSELDTIDIKTPSIADKESGPLVSVCTPITSCSQVLVEIEEISIIEPLFASTETITSEKAQCKDENSIEDWDTELQRQCEQYALEEKKLAQAQKVIRQQKAAQEKSARHAKVRQNLKRSSSSKSPFRTLLDSTELRLAYPNASALFLSNENICTVKANKFQWIFDSNVIIKKKHMKFLCALFNLKQAKGQLTFLDMAKTFWAIEKCFRKGKEGKDLRRTVFQWSHQFEINNVLVPPVKKEIHPEHNSSGFNHHQAIDLFDGGGFDPRFFRAIQ